MLTLAMDRLLSAKDSPTADLYFRNSCGDLLKKGVRQLAPTVFASPTACLVMRHGRRAGPIPSRRRLIYFVDDDVHAGVEDESLPFLYRQKLKWVERVAAQRLTRLAGAAVVGSEQLAALFSPSIKTHIIRPYWSEDFGGTDHFDSIGGPDAWVDLAFLGSRVHRSDLEFVLPVFGRLLAVEPRLRIHIPARHNLPAGFDAHPRVLRIRGNDWGSYRREIAQRRFHIAVYPLLDTPFNRGRSVNKLIEHAVVGAAPIYSASWSHSQRVREGDAGLCLPNDPSVWYSAIANLINEPSRARSISARAQKLGTRLNSRQDQRALWTRLLELPAQVWER